MSEMITEPLAHKLVMAAQNASQDCGCGPNESAIIVAVLWELATNEWGATYVALKELINLADEIEAHP